MDFGKAIKAKRIERDMSVEELAGKIDIPVSTLYRYESKDITKIPVGVIRDICDVLNVSIADLIGMEDDSKEQTLPDSFTSAQEAIEFLLKLPTLAAYGGYDINSMSEDEIVEFADEILHHISLVSLKYKYKDK